MSLELSATPEPPAADVASDSDSDISSYSDTMNEELQPTYDDPPHLSIPPNTWAEMERQSELRIMSLKPRATPEPPAADSASNKDSDMSSCSDEHKRATSPAPTSHRLTEMEEKINQLLDAMKAIAGHCDATFEEVAERMDDHAKDLVELREDVNSNTRHIAVATNNINTLQADQRHKDQTDALTDQSSATSVAAGVEKATRTPSADTCETGIFVSGIQELKRHFKMDPFTDPSKVTERLMGKIGCFHTINRINVADNAVNSSTRHKARAVIIYLNSVYHKRQAMARLRNFLVTSRLRVTVNDVFSAQETERANALNRVAQEKRQEKPKTRTRVVNKNGTAILQYAEGRGEPYKNSKISQEALQPYYKRTSENNRGINSNRGEGGNKRSRQEKELRDQEKANNRIGNAQHSNQQHHQHQQQQLPPQCPMQQEANKQQRQPAAPMTQNPTEVKTQQQQHEELSLQHPHPLQHQHQKQNLQRQPAVPQNGSQLHLQQQQRAALLPLPERGSQMQAPLQQQQHTGTSLHPGHHPQHHRNMQQQDNNNYSMMAAQQWPQGAKGQGPTVINPMEVNAMQSGYVPLHPQLIAAFLQQQFNAQHYQQQSYPLDSNGQQLLLQHNTSTAASWQGFE